MPEQYTEISVLDPIGPAFKRVKLILFSPFDLGRWFTIGFCAWLACLGQGGGPNFNFGHRFDGSAGRDIGAFISANLHWIIPVAIVALLLMIALGLVICWLSSRGRFMFLHCVAQNKAEVKLPWHKFKFEGNSLFLFRLVVGIISFLFFLVLGGLIAFLVIFLVRSGERPPVLGIVGIVALALVIILPVAIAFAVLVKFTQDFVVPIMFLRNCTCTEGWRLFWPTLTTNKARFTLYILFQIVIGMATGAIVFGAVIATCCCAGLILAIPYLGTVLLLPVLVFQRAYSLCYLRQYGPDFDCFSGEIVTPEPQPEPDATPDIQPELQSETEPEPYRPQNGWFSDQDEQ